MIKKINLLIEKYFFILIVLLSIPAIRYLFVDGYFGVSDDLHIGWLFEMDRTVKLLQFPPRYVPDLSFGFGYPLFNFVYPLPFYIAEIFHLVGFSLTDSIKILMGLSLPLSGYFMYKLLRIYLTQEISLAGSVLYIYAPYRALEIFVRGSIGEIVAFILFPAILYSITKLLSDKDELSKNGVNRNILFLSLSLGLLVLTHNIMAYMFVPFAVFYALLLVVFVVKNKKVALLKLFKSILLSLSLSIYFWLPAIVESGLVHYSTVFNFYDHYPTLKQLVTPFWGYGASVPGPYDTMSFYSGLVGVFTFLISLVYFVLNFKKYDQKIKILFIWLAFTLFVSVFMMNHRSSLLWQNLPLLPYFQFPWRFLAMLTLVYPLSLFVFSNFKSESLKIIVSLLVIVFSIFTTFNYFKYSEYLGRNDDYYINRYIPLNSVSGEYLKTGEEYLRLPKANTKRPDKLYDRAYLDEGKENVKINIKEINALDAIIITDSNESFNLNYSKYYYPGWKATINGQNVEITAGLPFGQIVVNVPSGQNEVHIYYKETNFRMILNIISLLTAIYLGVLSIRSIKND